MSFDALFFAYLATVALLPLLNFALLMHTLMAHRGYARLWSWFGLHMPVSTVAVVLSLLNIEAPLVLGSRLMGLEMLSAPIPASVTQRLSVLALVGNALQVRPLALSQYVLHLYFIFFPSLFSLCCLRSQDVPQLAIQVVVAVRLSRHSNEPLPPVTFLALAKTGLVLLAMLVRRLFMNAMSLYLAR